MVATKIKNFLWLMVIIAVVGAVVSTQGDGGDSSDPPTLRWDERLVKIHFTAKSGNPKVIPMFDVTGAAGSNPIDLDKVTDGYIHVEVVRLGDTIVVEMFSITGRMSTFFCHIYEGLKDITSMNYLYNHALKAECSATVK